MLVLDPLTYWRSRLIISMTAMVVYGGHALLFLDARARRFDQRAARSRECLLGTLFAGLGVTLIDGGVCELPS